MDLKTTRKICPPGNSVGSSGRLSIAQVAGG